MAKKIPDFKSEKEEEAFWETHDVRDYINWNNADSFIKRVFKDKKTEAEILKALTRTTPED
ncbi:MAG: CopG family antitoxin [bacterium]